jgi:hypothetical protein
VADLRAELRAEREKNDILEQCMRGFEAFMASHGTRGAQQGSPVNVSSTSSVNYFKFLFINCHTLRIVLYIVSVFIICR